jgi:hypothetical protein
MNFMVKTKGTLSCSLSLSLSVCLPPSLLSASQRQTLLLLQLSVFLASISRLPVPPCPVPPVLSLLCSENSGGRRPAQQQAGRSRRSTKEHTREQPEERRASGEWGGSVGRGGYYCSWFFTATLVCVVRLRRLQIARTEYFCSFFSFFISNFLENYYVFFLRRCYSTSLFMSCTRTLSIWKDARCRACVDCTVKSPCAPCLSSSMSCSTETVIPFGSL